MQFAINTNHLWAISAAAAPAPDVPAIVAGAARGQGNRGTERPLQRHLDHNNFVRDRSAIPLINGQ